MLRFTIERVSLLAYAATMLSKCVKVNKNAKEVSR